MRRGRRSFVQRQLRALWWTFVREEWRALLAIWGGVIALSAGMSALRLDWATGFASGSLVFAAAGMTGFVFVASTGGLNQLYGALCEGFTREEIAAATKDGSVWSAVHNLETERGDLDHLVLAPAGCIAIETKFYGSRYSRGLLEDHVRQARRGATRAKAFMNTAGRRDVTVCATALVVWGHQAPKGIAEVDEVVIVHGSALREWLRVYRTGPLGADIAKGLHQELERRRIRTSA